MKKSCFMSIKKIIACALILGGFSICTVPICSGFYPSAPAPTPEQPVPEQPVPEQARRVLPYIEALQRAGKPVYLVLGVSNNEGGLDRFDESYLFLDTYHVNIKTDPRSLKIDFNDIEQLSALSSSGNLHEVFDAIYVDGSVYEAMDWETKHCEYFRDMLKPGGIFSLKSADEYCHLAPTPCGWAFPRNYYYKWGIEKLEKFLSNFEKAFGEGSVTASGGSLPFTEHFPSHSDVLFTITKQTP